VKFERKIRIATAAAAVLRVEARVKEETMPARSLVDHPRPIEVISGRYGRTLSPEDQARPYPTRGAVSHRPLWRHQLKDAQHKGEKRGGRMNLDQERRIT